MVRKSNKYVEVNVNVNVLEDEFVSLCVDGSSEHKAVAITKDILELDHNSLYAGSAVRKDKRNRE